MVFFLKKKNSATMNITVIFQTEAILKVLTILLKKFNFHVIFFTSKTYYLLQKSIQELVALLTDRTSALCFKGNSPSRKCARAKKKTTDNIALATSSVFLQ